MPAVQPLEKDAPQPAKEVVDRVVNDLKRREAKIQGKVINWLLQSLPADLFFKPKSLVLCVCYLQPIEMRYADALRFISALLKSVLLPTRPREHLI